MPNEQNANFEQNSLLRRLPAELRDRLVGIGERRMWERGDVVYQRGQEIEAVYFPLDAMTSVMVNLQDDRVIEVATVGPDGFIGVPVLCGVTMCGRDVTVTATGEMLGVKVERLQSLMTSEPVLRETLHRSMLAIKFQSSQKTACSQLHATEQRLCWWILNCADATGQPELAITQQHLAWILGVRRATVTEILQLLREQNCISYRRGRITIEDRSRLEERCCECYDIVESYYQQLFNANA